MHMQLLYMCLCKHMCAYICDSEHSSQSNDFVFNYQYPFPFLVQVQLLLLFHLPHLNSIFSYLLIRKYSPHLNGWHNLCLQSFYRYLVFLPFTASIQACLTYSHYGPIAFKQKSVLMFDCMHVSFIFLSAST